MKIQVIFKDLFSDNYAFITDKQKVKNVSAVAIFVFKDATGNWNCSKTISILKSLQKSQNKKMLNINEVPTEVLELVNKVLNNDN